MNHPSTILLVDDHAANRHTLIELLDNPDYRLVEAADGPEALKLAAQLQPDLILLDVMMPEMDGFEVCRRLRESPRLAEVPVIMVTALDDRQSRIMGIGCGADDFISKPFDRAELRTRVKTITRLNSYGRLLRERAKVDEANQKVREQAALIDLATDAIVVLELDGRVQSWNPGAEKIFGTPAPEAHGRPLAALISKGDSSQMVSAIGDTLLLGEWRGDLPAIRPNGDSVTTHSHWTLLRHADGSARGILAVSTDQTEFKKLQAQFYRAQRMESLGALAGGIAHDLNNVLAPVLMAAEMLQADPPAEMQKEMAKVIQVSAERGAGLVRQILAFARGSDGQERMELAPQHLVRDAVGMAKETFPKAMTILSDLAADLFVIRADPTQIHQVLLNLMVNARDAMNGVGRLTVAAENRVLDGAFAAQKPGAKAGPHVVLRVTDTGSGMTPEVLAKIWNPFFTTKPPGKGTGIGLATVANIVKEHGGFVEVTSKPGAGTTFAIYLPATGGTATTAEATAPVQLPLGRGERVLVVDDEAALGQMIQALLAEHNYTATVADGPAAALSAFTRGEKFSLALVDLNMPVMDGGRLAKVMRNINPALSVILVTGSQEVMREQSKTSQFAAVVAKPFTAETLLVAMDKVLHG
ncbi:MAG: response regulator [Verrucomicrobia bacterium]|nr:response regulator [Verrucomicrobiota bacterium]